MQLSAVSVKISEKCIIIYKQLYIFYNQELMKSSVWFVRIPVTGKNIQYYTLFVGVEVCNFFLLLQSLNGNGYRFFQLIILVHFHKFYDAMEGLGYPTVAANIYCNVLNNITSLKFLSFTVVNLSALPL